MANVSNHPKQAWVVFSNETHLPVLRILKKKFRHCFVIIHDGEHWISIDPMAHYMEVAVQNVPNDFDLPNWLRAQGHNVVKARLSQEQKIRTPVTFFTCVEVCKRVLGIHKKTIITPWQLHKYLSCRAKD